MRLKYVVQKCTNLCKLYLLTVSSIIS